MKRFFKWIGTGLLIILLAGGAFAAHEWYADKPFYFNNLLNREMVKVAFDSPETLTSLGFLESMGITDKRLCFIKDKWLNSLYFLISCKEIGWFNLFKNFTVTATNRPDWSVLSK